MLDEHSEIANQVDGELRDLPKDLYIPPDALLVILDQFEGPLDLLLYLIRKQNLDILDIPIAEITRQYMQYIDLMRTLQLELAGEYLLMAAWLAEIKSRMLLPRGASIDEDEEDPRAALAQRLIEYEQLQNSSERLDALPRVDRDFLKVNPELALTTETLPTSLPHVYAEDLLRAMMELMQRSKWIETHIIQQEILSVRDRMGKILNELKDCQSCNLHSLFKQNEGRRGIIVVFLAALELVKARMADIEQDESFGPILLHSYN